MFVIFSPYPEIISQEEHPAHVNLIRTVSQIAAEYGVHPTQLAQWKKTALEGLPDLFENKGREIQKVVKEHQQEVEQLYKKIGDLTIQVDWLKKKSDEIILKRRKKGAD